MFHKQNKRKSGKIMKKKRSARERRDQMTRDQIRIKIEEGDREKTNYEITFTIPVASTRPGNMRNMYQYSRSQLPRQRSREKSFC